MTRMCLGVLGAGIMGKRIAKAAVDTGRFVVASVADADHRRASELADEYGASAHAGIRELFEGPAVDAVYIGLPHQLHLEACLAAAQADVHVLIDKPLCNTQDEADQIVAAAQGSSSMWMVGFSYRFRSEWRRAHEVIASGVIGTPYFVSDTVIEALRSTPAWYWDAASGGGALQLSSHHIFDRHAWLLASTPAQVACRVVRLPGSAEKSAQISIEYDNGVVAGVSLSFGLTYDAQPRTLCVVQGELGMVQLDFTRRLRIVTAEGTVEEDHTGDDWLGREIAEFADVAEGVRTEYPTLDDGVNALRGALAAARASQLQTWVVLDG